MNCVTRGMSSRKAIAVTAMAVTTAMPLGRRRRTVSYSVDDARGASHTGRRLALVDSSPLSRTGVGGLSSAY